MIYLEDLKYMKLYKKVISLPIDKKNKRKGCAVLLLTPDYITSNSLMNHPLVNNPYHLYESYYIEKDIMYTIQNESRHLEIAHYDYSEIIHEQPSVFIETVEDLQCYDDLRQDTINEFYCRLGDKMIFFNEMYDEEIYNEVAGLNSKYKTLLYNDRIRNNKEVFRLYDQVKRDNPWITKTYIDYSRYKQFNLFIDLYYYNQVYLGNQKFTINKSVDMYFEFIRRFINDKRIDKAGYKKKTVFVPIYGWNYDPDTTRLYDFTKTLNPISVLHQKLKRSMTDLKVFNGIDFVFFSSNGYFKMNTESITDKSYMEFIQLIKKLQLKEPIIDDEQNNSSGAIAADIINKLEVNKGIKIHNLTGEKESDEEQEAQKAELVKKINDASKNAADEEEALNKMEEDEDVKRLISDLAENSEDGVKLSAARVNRINKAQDELMKKKMNGKTIKQLVEESNKPKELPETALPIDTINEEWKHMKAINFEKEYDVNADIVKCLNSLSSTDKNYPVSILDISVEDTSTSEDSIYTYTVKCEGYDGKRFTLKFDIPKFRDNRFMRLRGNEKIFSAEMPLIPISKTDIDTVQIATFYNKMFMYTYYTSGAKTNPFSDRLYKALGKYEGKGLEIKQGNNVLICNKYNLPVDYIGLAEKYSKISFHSKFKNCKVTIYFNQDEIREVAKIDDFKGIPVAVASNGDICYYDDPNLTIAEFIYYLIEDEEFKNVFESTKPGKKFTYTRLKVLNTFIPTIVVLSHGIGLTKSMDLAGIEYDISDKKSRDYHYDSIKFADGYINYRMTYNSLMLMNGLKDCETEEINIASINSKVTWVDQLDNFGGRIKSDGLDNFRDLMYDPVTVEVSRDYDLPDNYDEALIYANNLLADNKYVAHTDLATNRYRTNEVVAAQFYRVMSDAYKNYAMQNKHGRQTTMYIPKDAVINLILQQNNTSDLSIFQPLLEIEAKNTVSTKGVTGMNSERAYNISKRGYDKSMVNIIAQATGFASTVGINRQTTLNPNITGNRGYFKQSSTKEMNITNSYCMTEALSPYAVSSDDVFRNDMTFVQTAKHSTPIEYGSPLLVTTGADVAMPYLVSDMYAHKAKKSGVVKEITEDYMIVEYDDKTTEYVILSEQTMKNSDGGFYITLQLKTDLKVGSRVKKDTILAYDKKSFSNRIGDGKQLGYNLGCITKAAIMITEDGFEDSGVASEFLSEAMSSDIVVMKPIDLPASTNILYLAKKGQPVVEGEPILVFQNAYDEEDANLLLKSLNNEDGDVSEIGRNVVKSKVTGVISDIKIYRTVDKEELSDSLKKIVTKHESEIKKLKSLADKAENDIHLDPCDKVEPIGKMKLVEGVKIEIYMKYHDKLSVGDKCVLNNANKVVLMNIYKDEDAPYTDFRPNEKIDIVGSGSAVDARMICSPIKLGGMYKLMIELSRKVCDIMGVKWKTLHEIYEEDMKEQ